MKATRKLIPAVVLLVISALLFSTASFAWFAMNRSVTTDGLDVTAKSNATFLLIGDNAGIAENKAGLTNNKKAARIAGETAVYPVTYNASKSPVVIGAFSAAANTWYTANNELKNAATGNELNGKAVTFGDIKYFVEYNVYLTLTDDSEDYTGKLDFTYSSLAAPESVEAKNNDTSATYIAVVVNGETLVLGAQNGTAQTAGNVTITKSTAVKVQVYVYVDGTVENVKSDYVNGGKTLSGSAGVTIDLAD